jgi:8-oxo-dGTP pyrophosphatase MutT (NUDIX family)
MRFQLEQLLQTHLANSEKEASDLAMMREFARTLERPFDRSQLPAHFTASALVVDVSMTHVCLVHHKKLSRWLQPGGHFEPTDVDVAGAAMREAREETGLEVQLHPRCGTLFDVDVHVIPARPAEPEHRHLDLRFLLIGRGTLRLDVTESNSVQWFVREASVIEGSDESVQRLVTKVAGLMA